MLITFRSSATETITMFQEVALQLIKLMGHSGTVPGALAAQDVAPALQALEAAIDQQKAAARAPQETDEDEAADDDEDEDRERAPMVDLPTRAVPLINLLRRAAAADAEVLWEGK